MNPFKDKHIVLGVSGSIAAYKIADLASKLTQAGAHVNTILTTSATRFITPLTFQALTGRPAHSDEDLWGQDAHILHVGLAHAADLIVVAPATANTLAKLAGGFADNLLTITALAASCPLLVAPAMDGEMVSHPATQQNLETLRTRGVKIVGPESGHLASGLIGKGRMTEPMQLLSRIRQLLARNGPLAGSKIVVTAGGTREALDPVRFLTNRSSGKQGYALAQAALDIGAKVTLISAPTSLETPFGAILIAVESAQEMAAAVLRTAADADALIMAAAVADYRPATVADQKIKKSGDDMTLALSRTQDILLAVAEQLRASGFPRVTVGFAAETENLAENAQNKLKRKGLDLIVANDVSRADAGFGVESNRVTIYSKEGTLEKLPLQSKYDVGVAVMARVTAELASALGEAEGSAGKNMGVSPLAGTATG